MHPSILSRLVSSELLFGVLHTLVWLLLALQLSTGVVIPLSEVFSGPLA